MPYLKSVTLILMMKKRGTLLNIKRGNRCVVKYNGTGICNGIFMGDIGPWLPLWQKITFFP